MPSSRLTSPSPRSRCTSSVTVRITVPLSDHGQPTVLCTSVLVGISATVSRQRLRLRRQQLEQLAEAHDGVEGGQELREDVAAARASPANTTPVAPWRPPSAPATTPWCARPRRRTRAASCSARLRDRERQDDLLALASPAAATSLTNSSSAFSSGDLLAQLVDDVEALARRGR